MPQAAQASSADLPRLLAELRARGITYLTGPSAPSGLPPLAATELLTMLAQADQPRVRAAAIALLLLHPSLAPAATQAIAAARSQGRIDIAEYLTALTLAALYLQRMWAWQLSLVLPERQPLPERPFAAYWRARDLPSPARDFGEPGLRQLAAYECRRTGTMADYRGDWLNQIQHLLRQEWTRQLASAPAPGKQAIPATSDARDDTTLEDDGMSFRPDVSREQIERFLREFGQLVHHPGRVYLVGGAALVHGNVRGVGATTVDIDLRLAVGDESEAEAAIRALITRLGINVELAYPGDFLPLPSGWETRSRYVGRYGMLEVFYFDFVTSALAKVDRGTDRDQRDVELLAQQGLISRDELDAAVQQILPQLGHGRFFNVDPQRFSQQYAAATIRLWDTPA